MKIYSNYFQTIHNEPNTTESKTMVNSFAVFRVPVWMNTRLESLSVPKFHTFAIPWDEDHDERVVQVAEKLFFAGVLQCIDMIYEHDGMILIRLLDEVDEYSSDEIAHEILNRLMKNSSPLDGDCWNLHIEGKHPLFRTDFGPTVPIEQQIAIDTMFTLGNSPVRLRDSEHKDWMLET